MPRGMEVGLGPGDFALAGTQLPLKGAQPPVFGPCVLWPNGWMDELKMPLGTEVDLGPGHSVLDGGTQPLAKEIQQPPPPPSLWSMSLWPRSPISAAAELLFAQLKAECRYTLQRAAPFPPLKITPSHGRSGPHLTSDSLGPSEPITQTVYRSVAPGLSYLDMSR